MLHEALMLEIYRQALNAGALPNPRPRSTESANSSERCPSHDSTSSAENGSASGNASNMHPISPNSAFPSMIPPSPNNSNSSHHHQQQQHLHHHHQQQQQQQHHHHQQQQPPPSMEAYLHMVAAAAQQYAQFPLGGGRMPMPIPPAATADPHFKLPPQASPTASSIKSEALDFRTNFKRSSSEDDEDEIEDAEEMEDIQEDGNPLDLSTSSRKRSADEDDSPGGGGGAQIAHQTKKLYKGTPPPTTPPAQTAAAPLMSSVNPYLAAVAAANIFQNGPYPSGGWNGKNDLVIDPTSCLEKMTDLVKGPRKEKSPRQQTPVPQAPPAAAPIPSNEGVMASKGRHNIWQSHWQNKGVASSVFRCVWCKQSFATLEALTTHMKDSKHCGVNVPPFSNLPNTERPPQQPQMQNHQQMRKPSSQQPMHQSKSNYSNYPSNRDPNTPLPRKLVRGQNVWLGKGVEQAMQILKCMRCGESFRSLGEMTKHMQETQHYTNILSQEQTISMKSSGSNVGGDGKDAMSSEESRTLSAVLTCKVCDKAFSSLGDLSNHMAKNNHYAEPLMQSMAGGGAAGRKRQVQKKREKSLPVRKLLEMKGAAAAHADAVDAMEAKMNRNEKMEAAMFAERMRQYICGVKAEAAPEEINKSPIMLKKSPEQEMKNGTAKPGSSSVLSAIEQMFTTSFDTPTRHNNAPQPVNATNKNTSPVASSILKRLGIDETVDYNKPLMDIQDPYYHHYARYTSSERSASECSADNHEAAQKTKARSETPEKLEPNLQIKKEEPEEKENSEEEERNEEKPKIPSQASTPNGELNLSTTDRNHEASPKAAASPESNRSGTPKSPASSHKSFGGDGEKKYPSDSLNALSSMFDSLSSVGSARSQHQQQQQQQQQPTIVKSEESLSAASNSLAALRQFCDQKEKTA
ncbi:protein teashirt [Eupeodes corollae]|uniref:protein teashirt n=1 Tax=Eupeodes corollae TaxID=290404 RepID=UPI00249365C6|nr:protein teashirt [Eupeodes corollae]